MTKIMTNISAINGQRNLAKTSLKMGKTLEKLSSGYRINRAADDAAGLAISEKMRAQIGGLAQAQRNAQDGVSLVQTAEGALNEVHSMLQRVRDLKVQYLNGTLDADDKKSIVAEVTQLADEIGEIASKTEFNGINLLGGTGGSGGVISFQVGANTDETVSVTTRDIAGVSGTGAIDGVSDTAGWEAIDLDDVDTAINNISDLRSEFGAVQNRLEHRLNNLAAYQENLVASESRIRDVDMASEMVNFTKLGILQQAGTSMLAQANQAPQNVLSLLRQ